MKKLVKRLFGRQQEQLDIPVVSCSFSDDEKVMYGEDEVIIQGIWKDCATVKFDDGSTINVGIDELRKLVV